MRQRSTPVPALLHRVEHLAMSPLVSSEAVHRTGQVWERLQVAAAFEVSPVDERREPHHVGPLGRAEGGDELVHTQQGIVELSVQAVDARHTGRNHQTVLKHQIPELEVGPMDGRACRSHLNPPCAGAAWRRSPARCDRY